MLKGVIDTLTNLMVQLKPIDAYQYCALETTAGINPRDNEHYPCLLTVTGGFVSAIEIEGITAVIGREESTRAHAAMIEVLEFMVDNDHELDIGFTQAGDEAKDMVAKFFDPQKVTARRIGLNIDRQLESAKEVMANYVRPEHCVLYVTTNPRPEHIKGEVKSRMNAIPQVTDLFGDQHFAQPVAGILGTNAALRNEHMEAVVKIAEILKYGGMSVRRLGAREIPWSIKRDADYQEPGSWKAWLWGDKARIRSTPEDRPGEDSLLNFGGPSLGMQIHEHSIMPTSNPGILKVGPYYVAPLLLELLPEKSNWFSELLTSVPKHMPFRYRASIQAGLTSRQRMNKFMASMFGWSKQMMPENKLITDSYQYITELKNADQKTCSIAITMCTWAESENKVKANLQTLRTKIAGWGNAKSLVERGDPAEAVIATIPGFGRQSFVPFTHEALGEVAKLLPITRPACPFKTGQTMLRTECGKPFYYSPTSSILPAFIELLIGGTGGGKSVAQGGINRDSNLKPGNKQLSKHTTIDIGPSGKNTVNSMRSQLPPNRAHEAVYEKLSLSERHAFNPFDLQLGAFRPTSVDMGWLEDFLCIIFTARGQNEPSKFMAELITEIIAAAYERAFTYETAKEYRPGIAPIIDEVLSRYPEASGDIWGARKTWIKVQDFLFERGHVREATIAQRYVVPLLPDLGTIFSQNASIKQRFASLADEFTMLLSAATKRYPLLTQPTKIDFDSARYLILDLNDVTQQQDSPQTGIMYALAAQMGTRDYWLNREDIEFIRGPYQAAFEKKVIDIREVDLSVTFEEYRRTQSQPRVRSMVNRWCAEGRKFGVRVQVVMQMPDHADRELFGHATVIMFLGVWNGTMLEQLKEKGVTLTPSEKYTIMNKLRGATSEGASMLIRYNSKADAWSSQLVYMTKSVPELWAASTTKEDARCREVMEEKVGNPDLANEMLCLRYPQATVKELVERRLKEATEMNVAVEDIYSDLADEAIDTWKRLKGSKPRSAA